MKQLITLFAVIFSATVFGQNVGIGEVAPTEAKLQVKTLDSATLLLHNTTASGSNIKSGLFFKTGGSYSGSIATIGSAGFYRLGLFTFGSPGPSGLLERMSILDGGNVGIGTTSPSSKLEISGQIKITGGSPAAGRILESDATGLATWVDKPAGLLPVGISGNTLRHNGTAWIATSNLYNDGSKIGIGTTTPGSMLELKPSFGTADIELNATPSGDNAVIRLNKNGTSSYSAIRFKNVGTVTWDLGTQGDNNFKLKHTPTNTTIIDVDEATKNIGIGTNDYSEKINVSGNVAAYGTFISKFSNAGFLFEDRTANAYGGWNWYANAGKANLYRYGSGGDLLTIDQVGNVGIGNTSPTSPLSFATTIGKKISMYAGPTGDAGFGVFGNELRINADYNGADITFGYDNFTNGFTERMRVKGNGNVGIGTNAPTAPLSFANAIGNKITLWGDASGPHYGLGIQGSLLQMYSSGSNADIAFGYGSSGALTENVRLFGNGNIHIGKYSTWGTAADNRKINFGDGDYTYIGEMGADDRLEMQAGSFNFKNGDVYIGTNNFTSGAGYKLRVGGKIFSEEVRVQLQAAWPDYVFEKNYKKLSLNELEKFVNDNKHLPNIPSALEIEKDGQHLGDIQRKMLEKIEELSLYVIELKKEIDELKKTSKQ
jgi:hypothetical protein